MPDVSIRITARNGGFDHELVADGAVVSRLTVWDLPMRVGCGVVRMGGIGGVHTDKERRNKGLARRLLENSNLWMAEQGFDCAILFGISDFYHRFGYAVCLPRNWLTLRTRDAEAAPPRLRPRPVEPADMPRIRDLYAENNACMTGAIVRGSESPWFRQGSRWSLSAEAACFVDAQNSVRAYAARDVSSDDVTVTEAAAERPAHIADVAHWAAQRAIEIRSGRIRFLLPTDSPLTDALTDLGAVQKITYPLQAEGMGRIQSLHGFLSKTLNHWAGRARSAAPRPGASVELKTDIGSAALRWTGESIEMASGAASESSVSLPQWRLMQLAMGYHGSAAALSFPEVTASGDMSLFHALFPRKLPHMWAGDYF